jgi:hypothetical protein
VSELDAYQQMAAQRTPPTREGLERELAAMRRAARQTKGERNAFERASHYWMEKFREKEKELAEAKDEREQGEESDLEVEITRALCRGYCDKANARKTMDQALILAMSREVLKLFGSKPGRGDLAARVKALEEYRGDCDAAWVAHNKWLTDVEQRLTALEIKGRKR